MTPIRLAEGVHFVGVFDPDLRLFDLVMHTPWGTSYNAYLVRGREKTALVDAVKHGFEPALLSALEAALDGRALDYVVVNHAEPDHAGALAAVLERFPGAIVVGTNRAVAFVGEQLNRAFPSRVVKAGDSLDLGGRTLQFVPAPFLHWPDTMFTWLPEERILFSCDVFGAHYCVPAVFDDALDAAAAADLLAARKVYYDAILGPFAGHVAKGLQKVAPLAPATIAPSHGPVLRGTVAAALAEYQAWSAGGGPKRAAVCYASVYGYTKALAAAVAEGLRAAGVATDLVDLAETDLEQAAGVCWAADAIVLGAPTLNGVPAPQAGDLLGRLDPFRAKGKLFAAFGSYGWSGEGPGTLVARAQELKMQPVDEPLKVAFAPTGADLDAARALGAKVAAALAG
jgi:flavorubredoxin